MQRIQSQLFVALLTFACLSFAMAKTTAAGAVKFPSDDPAFTVEFPPGWTYEHDKDGNINCDPRDDSGYAFSILLLKEVHSEKELNAELPELAKSMASGAKLKNFRIGDVEGTESGSLRFAEVKGQGKADGVGFVVVVTGFEPQKSRFYAMVSAGSEQVDKKHAKDYEAIAASIEPLPEAAGKENDAQLPITDTTLGWDSKTGHVAVYFKPDGKCTIDFQGNDGRFEGREDEANSHMERTYEVKSLAASKWRVRIFLGSDDHKDVTFRITKRNQAAKSGETVITAMGTNEGDPYQGDKEAELKFVRGKQSRPPQ